MGSGYKNVKYLDLGQNDSKVLRGVHVLVDKIEKNTN